MAVLRDKPEVLPAICRYAECKALFGGTTTTQGIRLARANALCSYYRGIVRNVEMPDDARLPRGESRMADVAAKEVHAFAKTLARFDKARAAYLLHLSEGCDPAARAHFVALHIPDDGWAIDRALAGIHCVGLASAALHRVLIVLGVVVALVVGAVAIVAPAGAAPATAGPVGENLQG